MDLLNSVLVLYKKELADTNELKVLYQAQLEEHKKRIQQLEQQVQAQEQQINELQQQASQVVEE